MITDIMANSGGELLVRVSFDDRLLVIFVCLFAIKIAIDATRLFIEASK